ncbi:nicotinate-nucleotide--dimethylbenzimidazole phosphoribosyltransferase [Streptomyces sp. NPDC004647]|uniref:nicotinate-nucleotide--dimethylbenzimidazole phosphoribosyltransferase n=1 Tax=Streptomyces sp. NPDC004647 TaxID=3154671 RepID=UPI0033BC74F4
MTDTGQVPGEGLPENAGGQQETPQFAAPATPAGAGLPEQSGTVPAPGAYAFHHQAERVAEEEDQLLMPGSQGPWSDLPPAGEGQPPMPYHSSGQVQLPQQVNPYQQHQESQGLAQPHAQPYPPLPHQQTEPHQPTDTHHPTEPQQPGQEAAMPGAGPEAHPAAGSGEYEPGIHQSGTHETGGRDTGSVDYGAVRIPQPTAPQSAGRTSGPATPTPARRPLHAGPPVPETSGGVVRSLADRGPAGTPTAAARYAGPATTGPEYLDVPREETPAPVPAYAEQYTASLPGPQLGEIPVQGTAWDLQPPSTAPQAAPGQVPGEAEGSAETVGRGASGEGAADAAPEAAEPAAPGSGSAFPSVPESEVPHDRSPVAEGEGTSPETAAPGGPEQVDQQWGRPSAGVPVSRTEPRPPSPGNGSVPAGTGGTEPGEAVEQAAAEVAQPVPAEPSDPRSLMQPQAVPVTPEAPGEEAAARTEAPVAAQQPAEIWPAPEAWPEPESETAREPEAEAVVEAEAVAAPPVVLADALVAAKPVPAAEAAAEAAAEPTDVAEPAEQAAAQGSLTEQSPEQAPEETTAEKAAEAAESDATDAEAFAEAEAEAEANAEADAEAEAVVVAGPGGEGSPEATGTPAAGYGDAEREAVLRVMRERRDIRNGFRTDPIPHDVLLRVLEAAHTAPSVGHSQPWDFVVIRSAETRRTMHELAGRQREAYAKSLPKGRAKQFKELKIEAILDTPVNIVVTADPTRGGRHTLGRHTQPQMAPYSSALAVENLWLAARAEGLGVGWVSFFDEREMVRALGLPEHLEVVAYLCVGYVDEFPDEPELLQAGWSKRRPLSWVVHEETYGRRALPGEDPHDLLAETLQGIRPLDAKALGEAWERQKRMTKPAGALGMLEIISAQLSGLSRQCPPPIPEPAAVAIFAGDHGVHAQGVTPWPQEVTAQMVANFLGGGAVCNAFANQVGAEVCVVDVGVAGELPSTPGLLPRKIRPGTDDFTTGPALSREDVLRAIEVGIESARDLVSAGNKALLTGEMGIANTTVSAALISVYTGKDPGEVTGRGTGINDETHARKVDVVRRALELHQPDPADPIGVLAAVGGLEHAALVGLLLGAASLRTPVILDGVSAGAAALVARAIAPEVLAACIAGHRSAEPGHVAALTKLGLRPLIDLDLRLGEGTGALLALPVVQSAARAMHEVATFDSAGVTEKA